MTAMTVSGRWSVAMVWVTAVAVLGGAPQTFRSGVALVHLPVVVLDRAGAPVRGLTADDFEVRDGGVVREVVSFAEGPPGPSVPLHLGLMLDKSESMEKDIKSASDAAIDLIDALPEARDVTFVEFDTGVRIARFEPPSYPRLFERIRARALGPLTALYDAMGHYAAGTRERPGQHLLLVYTDGGDSSRGLNANDVRDLLRLGNVIVYTVGYLDHATGSDRARQQAVLSQLARETGGDAFFPSGEKDTQRIYRQIRAEIEGRYTIGYVRPVEATPGRFQRVDVRLRREGIAGARVRTRSGYVPAEP